MTRLTSRPAAVREYLRMRSLGFSPLSSLQSARCVGVYERSVTCGALGYADTSRRDSGAVW